MEDLRRYRLLIEYDGTDFSGWQRQRGVRTVQQTLEETIESVIQQSIRLVGAGRTDAGVHAIGQVAHFDAAKFNLTDYRFIRAVNSRMPQDVRLLELSPVNSQFSARYSAVSRSYTYRVERTFHPLRRQMSWHPKYRWDDLLIKPTVELLYGCHSFRSFSLYRPKEMDYSCIITDARWESDVEGATFYITANRFLYKMVRGLVNTLIDVGRGFYTPKDFKRLLDEPLENSVVRYCPPQGLTLVKVEYPEELLREY